MGCNCKTNEKIKLLTKKYGYNINVSNKESMYFTISEIVKYVILFILGILLLPISVMIILFLIFNGKTNFNVYNFTNFLLRKK